VTKPGNSDPAEPTADKAAEPTAESHESPTRAPGGPPNSTLPASTDNSGSGEVAAENGASAAPAESADAEPAAEPEPAASKSSEEMAAEEMAAATAREKTAKSEARRAKAAEAAEDPEPLMAELEKAPPPPDAEARRAQAKRRFEEPPPRMLRFSFYFFTAAGLVWLGSMVLSLLYKQQIIDAQIKANKDPKITPDQIVGAVNQILWIVTIAALAFTIFLALFGYKATEGTRRGRTLVTIFAIILVIFHLFLNGTQLGILSAMFGLVGLALLWAPSSRAYFPPRELR
jgi:hypothetical protein